MNALLHDALNRLPHGPEFRFLDQLTQLEPGREGAGEYTIHPEAPYLRGHFPGNALFPGVLLLEACAQLAGVVAQSDLAIPPLMDLKLTGVRAIKIYGTARPGDTITLHARIQTRLGGLIHTQVNARLDQRLLLEGEIVLSGQEPQNAP